MTVVVTPRLKMLAAFIRWLFTELGYEFKVSEDFEDRFRLQKYVFLAKHFGLDLDYDFNLYMYGPYSQDLARDYYGLDEWKVIPEAELPREFRAKEFKSLVRGKDVRWLELAATLVDVYHYNKSTGIDEEMLLKIVSGIKHWASKEELKKILKELTDAGLIVL